MNKNINKEIKRILLRVRNGGFITPAICEIEELLKEDNIMVCPKCGKRMENVKDQITGKISKYLFGCKCYPNRILSKG